MNNKSRIVEDILTAQKVIYETIERAKNKKVSNMQMTLLNEEIGKKLIENAAAAQKQETFIKLKVGEEIKGTIEGFGFGEYHGKETCFVSINVNGEIKKISQTTVIKKRLIEEKAAKGDFIYISRGEDGISATSGNTYQNYSVGIIKPIYE